MAEDPRVRCEKRFEGLLEAMSIRHASQLKAWKLNIRAPAVRYFKRDFLNEFV
jgi:hypothetical protein